MHNAKTYSACVSVILPEASGLFDFVGFFLSRSKSRMSLTMYPTLEMKQKATNARTVFHGVSPSRIFPAATGAAKTRRFLAHCFGRIVIIKGEIIPKFDFISVISGHPL